MHTNITTSDELILIEFKLLQHHTKNYQLSFNFWKILINLRRKLYFTTLNYDHCYTLLLDIKFSINLDGKV